MTTIRRIYVYTVCLISLQWAAFSIKSLMDAALRWALVGQRSDLGDLVFPLAVVIVGTPVFLGHWLWAQWQVNRDPDERASLIRQIYLALTQALLTAYLAVAIYAGIDGILRLALLLIAPDMLRYTFGDLPTARAFALADFLSSLPTLAVTLGLWLYHRWVSARDEAGRPAATGSVSKGLDYLISLGFSILGGGLLAGGIFGLQVALYRLPGERMLAGFSASAGLLAAGAALWAVHERFVRRSPGLQAGYKRLLRGLGLQAFSLAGLILTAAGLVGIQEWILHRLGDLTATGLPDSLAQLTTGLALLVYHEIALRRFLGSAFRNPMRTSYAFIANLVGLVTAMSGSLAFLIWLFDGFRITPATDGAARLLPGFLIWLYFEWELRPVQSTARWLFHQLYSLLGWLVAAIGLGLFQSWLMGWLASNGADLEDALAGMLTGLWVLGYYELRVRQRQPEEGLQVRWLIAWLAHGLGVFLAVVGAVNSLGWLFHPRLLSRFPFPEAAALLLPGAVLWLYFQRVQRTVQSKNVPILTRLSVYTFSGLGVGLAAFGLVGVQEWLFGRITGETITPLHDALAALVTGLPVWLYFWRRAGRLFASRAPSEQKSDLRKAYLFLIIYLTVNTAVLIIGLLLNGLFLNLFGIPTQGGLGLLLAVLIAAVVLWVYHAWVLNGDIRQAGETSRQGNMQRLYWYLVAAVGLLAGVIGAAGSLGALLRLLAEVIEGSGFPTALRAQLAASLAACLAGLPVWASAWFPAQRLAVQLHESGLAMRRSILRKAYLYVYLLGATLAVLIFAIRTVFQLLSTLFGLSAGASLLAQIGESLAFTLIGSILWIYHMWVLRGDARLEKQEKATQAELNAETQAQALADLRQKWASYPVAIVDDPAGQFAAPLVAELTRQLPYLTVYVVDSRLQPKVSAEASPQSKPPLPGMIIAPWSAALPGSPLNESSAVKWIVPTEQQGLRWVGAIPSAITAAYIVQIVRQSLPPAPPPEAGKAVGEEPAAPAQNDV